MGKIIYTILYWSVFIMLLIAIIYLGVSGYRQDNIDQYLTDIDIPTNNVPILNLPHSSYELNNSERVGLGVFIPDVSQDNFSPLLDFENMINHKLEYLLLFRAWGDPDREFPSSLFRGIDSLGLSPIITWEPWSRDFDNPEKPQARFSLKSIAQGGLDSYIVPWAEAAAQQDQTIILRFGHEMNTPPGQKIWYPWQGEPKNYVSAYRHIVNVFRKVGADNVKFMWNPILYTGSGALSDFYPGSSYVNYIGITAINLGEITGRNGEDYNWLGCDTLISDQINKLKRFKKPIVVTEMLSNEIGGSKADWYTECLKIVEETPEITGLISVQIDADYAWSHNPVDWRVNSSEASLDAFKQGVLVGFK